MVDTELVLKQPFNIRHWVDANRMQLNEEGSLSVFEEHSQFQVFYITLCIIYKVLFVVLI